MRAHGDTFEGFTKMTTYLWVNDSQVSLACLKGLSTNSRHIFALSTLLDLISHGFQPSREFIDVLNALSVQASDYDLAETDDLDLPKTICTMLECEDLIRANYWRWHKSKLP